METNTTTSPETNVQFSVISTLETNGHLKNFTIVMVALNAVSSVLTTAFNFLVILTFAKTRDLRCAANIFILSLACTDFIVGVFMQPVHCLYLIANLTGKAHLSAITSQIYLCIFTPLTATSFLTITAITVDRFLALKLHLRYNQVVTTEKAIFMALYIWFSGIFWGVIYAQWKEKDVVRMLDNAMALITLAINFYLMFKIAMVIRRHSKQIFFEQQLRQPRVLAPNITAPTNTITDLPRFKKTVNTMHFIMGIFLACYVPITVVVIVDSFKPKDVEEVIFGLTIFADFMLMLNSGLNPIIYCLRIQDIRTAIKGLIGCSSASRAV